MSKLSRAKKNKIRVPDDLTVGNSRTMRGLNRQLQEQGVKKEKSE